MKPLSAIRWTAPAAKPVVKGQAIRVLLAVAALASSSLALEAGRRWH